jgi:N6-adenosine-specific RNA methylase IME4
VSGLINLPAKRYGAILADPPWSFKSWSGKTGTPHCGAHDHHPVQGVDWLKSLQPVRYAAPDCALFMWAVDSHLDVAIDLMKVWGFAYKTKAFTWVKTAKSGAPRIGMGYWTRKSAEVCLMGVHGAPKRRDKGVREVIMAPRREHSRKPDETYDRIERLVGGPYLELFARQAWPGWDVWGNETGKFSAERAA